jgi:hypothetical protein
VRNSKERRGGGGRDSRTDGEVLGLGDRCWLRAAGRWSCLSCCLVAKTMMISDGCFAKKCVL